MRNYGKEDKWEDSHAQVVRREARNAVRQKALHAGRIKIGDTRQFDHVGFHPHGSLRRVPTKLVSQHANEIRQPPHKG